MSDFSVKLLCILAPFVLLSPVSSGQSFHELVCWHGENKVNTSSQNCALVKDLPCAVRLLEPCPLTEVIMGMRTKSSVTEFIEQFFAVLTFYAGQMKEKLVEISSHKICNRFGTSTLANVPTTAELKKMTTEKALRRIHQSLLAHLAQALIADYKLNYTDIRCFEGSEEKQDAIKQAFDMVKGLVAIACVVDQRLNVTGYERDDVTTLLNEQISKPRLCIEGTLLFCLVSTSSVKLFEEISNYANEEIEDIYDKINLYENLHYQ